MDWVEFHLRPRESNNGLSSLRNYFRELDNRHPRAVSLERRETKEVNPVTPNFCLEAFTRFQDTGVNTEHGLVEL